MTLETTPLSWNEANQQYLTHGLSLVRERLREHARRRRAEQDQDEVPEDFPSALPPIDPAGGRLPALEIVCTLFHLSPFERDILLLCAGMELDSDIAALCASAHGDPQRPYPTFSLALAIFPEAHWSALTPDGPLRKNRLIEVGPGNALTLSPLRIDERVLHYLVGVNHQDQHLLGIIDTFTERAELVPSHAALAERIAAIWARAMQSGLPVPIIQLCGADSAAKRAIAAEACALLGFGLSIARAEALPAEPPDMETLLGLWDREAALSRNALLLECGDSGPVEAGHTVSINRLLERSDGLLLLSAYERRAMRGRAVITLDIAQPTADEQRAVWREALGPEAARLNGHIDLLTAQFDMCAQVIRAASVEAIGRRDQAVRDIPAIDDSDARVLAKALWQTCRVTGRPRLDDLAVRIDSRAGWDDLVLPGPQQSILQDVAAHVRHRTRVYEQWGFSAKGARGLGISALFAGPSGTGKTMAAEVLARELDLDLYRIDLSAVVSKYIGESEKNLRRVFDAAEEGGAILLFDEADALFGKRTETKDSHDRYANLEVSYLLQRMESYRGLAILTTNFKSALDHAFLRRLRFIVQFPFPDTEQRAEIWRRAFPPDSPTENLDMQKLARLNIAGGNIRNTALNAAFMAANSGEPIQMIHLLRAAQAEYSKIDKTLTETEVSGWV